MIAKLRKKYLPKLKRRFVRFLNENVPYQRGKYAPTRTLDAKVWAESHGARRYVLEEARMFVPEIPDDFKAFANENGNPLKPRLYPEISITEIPNGRIWTDNVTSVCTITPDLVHIHEYSVEMNQHAHDTIGNRAVEIKFWTEPLKLKGRVLGINIGFGGHGNFFQYIMNVLPRLGIAERLGLLDTVDWFHVPSLHKAYQRQALQALGIPLEKCICADEHPHIQADVLLGCSNARNGQYVPQWVVDYMRPRLMAIKDTTSTKPMPKRIYISRKDSPQRRVTNEEALVAELAKHGFVELKISEYTFPEQVRLFSEAEAIVGAHGAGFTGLLYANPNAWVVEFFNPLWLTSMYYQLARAAGQRYYYHIDYKQYPDAKFGDIVQAPMTADIEAVMALVRKAEAESKVKSLK